MHSLKWLLTESAIFGFRLNSNMLNISFAIGMFWEHLFSMDFNVFPTIYLIF